MLSGIFKYPQQRSKKISEAMKGDNNPAKRLEVRKKIGEANKNRIVSKVTREKIGRRTRNKTYEEIYGNKATSERKKRSIAHTGKEKSEKHKKHIGESREGKHYPKLSKALSGRKLSKEHKTKISISTSGENNPNFKEGISFEPYGLEFNNKLKEQIRKRDNYICQECGIHQDKLDYKLHCHHIDYNKKNNNLNNLISLCRSCHLQTNYKRQDWTKYFKNKSRGITI